MENSQIIVSTDALDYCDDKLKENENVRYVINLNNLLVCNIPYLSEVKGVLDIRTNI